MSNEQSLLNALSNELRYVAVYIHLIPPPSMLSTLNVILLVLTPRRVDAEPDHVTAKPQCGTNPPIADHWGRDMHDLQVSTTYGGYSG